MKLVRILAVLSLGACATQDATSPGREAAAVRHEPRYRAPGSEDAERSAIVAAPEHSGGAVSHAAELLGMGRTTLWRKSRDTA